MKSQLVQILVLGVGVVPPLLAVERPAELDEQPYELKTIPLEKEEPTSEVAIIESEPTRGEKPFLGIGSQTVDETLAMHLNLKNGVVVKQVHEKSGAAKAGLKVHDVILSLDGAEIDSPEALRDAITQCEVGEEVTVVLLRGGQKEERVVALGRRPKGVLDIDQIRRKNGFGGLRRIWPDTDDMPGNAREHAERLKEMLDGDLGGVGLRLHEQLNEIFDSGFSVDGGSVDFDFDMGSSVTWADNEGDVTLKKSGDKTLVTVRDQAGNVVYDGPWDTEEDKAKVDEGVRKRIDKLGVGEGGKGFKFRMEDGTSHPGR